MSDEPTPSDNARALLREEAKRLDVEDLVDLGCTRLGGRGHEPLRVATYLEALRTKSGELAQLGALILSFELARHGDLRLQAEVELLLPVVDALVVSDPRALVAALVDRSEAVEAAWNALCAEAQRRDPRVAPAVPVASDELAIEIDLFDEIDLDEIGLVLDEAIVLDGEATHRFARDLDGVWQPGALFFAADSDDDLDRMERVRGIARSFSSSVPVARELRAMSALFVATHTRAAGFFGKRNKRRDDALREALETFALLPGPPVAATAWLEPGGDLFPVPGHAWEKMAEVLLDFAAHVALSAHAHDVVDDASLERAAVSYVASDRSKQVPQVLAASPKRRRRES